MRVPSLANTALVALVAGAVAQADILNPDVARVTPQLAFAGLDRHPEYVFLIHVRDKSYWGPSVAFKDRIIPIPSQDAFTPGFHNTIERVTILAVPQDVYANLAEDDRQTLSSASPGVRACEIPRPKTSRHVRDPDPGVQNYRVSIADGKLTIEPDIKAQETSVTGGRVGWGIALAACVAWLGVVVGRRFVRRAS